MYTHPYGRGETCVYLSWTVRCIHIHMAGERHVFIYHGLLDVYTSIWQGRDMCLFIMDC